MYFTTRGFQSQTFAGQQLEMVALAMESVRSASRSSTTSFVQGRREPSPEQSRGIARHRGRAIWEHRAPDDGGRPQDTDNIHIHVSLNTVTRGRTRW
jgi:hypothetical protein